MDYSELTRLVNGSIEYRVEDSILTISSYYDRTKAIRIDLNKLTPELLEELEPDEDYDEEEEY